MTEARAALVINAFWPMVKAGFLYSIPLAIVSFFLGLIIAVGVALLRVVPAGGWLHKLALLLVKFYVSAIRGTPMLARQETSDPSKSLGQCHRWQDHIRVFKKYKLSDPAIQKPRQYPADDTA